MSKLIPWTKLSDDTSKVWYDTVSQDWCQRFHEALPSTLCPIPESKLVISAGEAARATVSLNHGLGASFCLHTSFAHTLYWHKHGIITHTSRLQRQNILLQSMTTTMARASFRPQVHQNSKLLKLSPEQPRSMPAAHKTRIVSPLVVLILTELLAVYVCSKLWRFAVSLHTHTHTQTRGLADDKRRVHNSGGCSTSSRSPLHNVTCVRQSSWVNCYHIWTASDWQSVKLEKQIWPEFRSGKNPSCDEGAIIVLCEKEKCFYVELRWRVFA